MLIQHNPNISTAVWFLEMINIWILLLCVKCGWVPCSSHQRTANFGRWFYMSVPKVMQAGKMTKDRMHTYRWVNASMHACTVTLYALCMWKQKTHTVHIALYVYIHNIYIIRGIYHIQNMILTIFCQDSTLPFYTRFSLQLWSKLVEKPLLPKRFASESQRFHVRIIQRLTCESSHKDRRWWPPTTWQQQQPTTKSIAATQATTYRRKFRSLTSDNMDSWKSSAARKKINRCGKKEDQQARNVREVAKCCVFQCFVCRLGRKVT